MTTLGCRCRRYHITLLVFRDQSQLDELLGQAVSGYQGAPTHQLMNDLVDACRRAQAAGDYLQQRAQVAPGRLQVVGHGEHQPVASNETAEGRRLNRRIEIRLLPGTGVGV